jgi:hypothetical protein
VLALKADTGTWLGSSYTVTYVLSSPTVADHVLYVGSAASDGIYGTVYAFGLLP